MLQAHEELWEMNLGDAIEDVLEKSGQKRQSKTEVVKYKIPANSIVQVYDYKTRDSRVVVGPNLVMLGPDESFTLNRLSGKTPKTPGVVRTLNIRLGPDFSSDIVEVDTADHAKLSV